MDPIFKGCTRPAMLKGAPMTPLMSFCVPIFMLGIPLSAIHPLSLVMAFVLCIGVWLWMRAASEKDEQRLVQLMRVWWHRRLHWATAYIWIGRNKLRHNHGLFSYSPVAYRKNVYLLDAAPFTEAS